MPTDEARRRLAQGHRAMALGWIKRRRLKQAVVEFHRALQADPSYFEVYLELGQLFMQLHRWADVIALCHDGLTRFMELAELHKMLITGLEEQGTLDDAYAHYQLSRTDSRDLVVAQDEILCCVAVRNERPRLPGFLAHYRRLGVDRFFFVDNDSSDGTAEWLLTQPDVHVWQSPLSFKRANFGSVWFELLLRRHGIGHWCLTVDADEFMVYDGYPDRSLHALCRDLDARGMEAASGVLLDMYSDRAVRETFCDEGADPIEVCAYFDRRFCHTRDERAGQYRNQTIFFGGARQRVFPGPQNYLLSKVPLLRYQPRVVLASGQHLTTIPYERIAHEQVCLLHFKFLASFLPYAREEARREVHAMGATQYKAYAAKLAEDESVSLHDPAHSVRFEGITQLRELGVMRPEPAATPVTFPLIAPVSLTTPRPFWSVMITVYRRLHNLERVVGSVLQQATPDMQIEVINDGADPEIQGDLGLRLQALAGDRVHLHCLSENVGHPHIFNLCIERARGEWVHILHDDDWVEPGFYAAIRDGISQAPQIGAAFSQHAVVTQGRGETTDWRSWAERETPGIIADWLARISVECRVQFSSMVVRRSAYESVGGFCAEALSAFDWEMWKRIAVHFPVWYVPEVLVSIGRDESAESTRLERTGEQVAHSLRAVEISQAYLPPADTDRLSSKARERCCLYALGMARQFLREGNEAAALANLRAAVAGAPPERVLRVLTQVLKGVQDEFCP
ncbi:MAG: glycosyltransferase family 2 protein [Acidobacteria bacterium]|jgi:GT2 family glycosyltransferase|nr:glycosyltransferase family 2 protein [Acidobacteriota bacterium]